VGRSVWDVNQFRKRAFGTLNNTFEQFPVGKKVRIICVGQDMTFFRGNELGTVIKNSGDYLGIIVEFDKPRHFVGGYVQESFNFEPSDLLPL